MTAIFHIPLFMLLKTLVLSWVMVFFATERIARTAFEPIASNVEVSASEPEEEREGKGSVENPDTKDCLPSSFKGEQPCDLRVSNLHTHNPRLFTSHPETCSPPPETAWSRFSL